jgi:hypothetical protein
MERVLNRTLTEEEIRALFGEQEGACKKSPYGQHKFVRPPFQKATCMFCGQQKKEGVQG